MQTHITNDMNEVKKINLNDTEVKKETLYNDGDIAFGNSLGDAINPQNVTFDFYAVMLCLNGEVSFRINGQSHTMHKNDILICPPNVIISDARHSDDMQCDSIAISPNYFKRILPIIDIGWNVRMAFETHPILPLDEKDAEIFCQYHDLLQKKVKSYIGKYQAEVIDSLMLAFIYEFRDAISKFFEKDERPFSSAKYIFQNFIETLTNMYPKRRNVAYYADVLNITPKYLTAICSSMSGQPASKIIDTYVIKDISDKLRYTHKSVKEISNELGFPNLSFFGKYVKKHLGVSPKSYRERLVSGNSAIKTQNGDETGK